MKLVILTPRRDNDPIEVGEKLYKFKPNKEGLLVCDVPDEHAVILLQHKDSYLKYVPGMQLPSDAEDEASELPVEVVETTIFKELEDEKD